MLKLERLIDNLPARPDLSALVQGFVPPARFAEKRFDNYQPRTPAQAAARDRLAKAAAIGGEGDGGILGRLRSRWSTRRPGGGIYLDGGFGVGKTHLLAAFWNAAPSPKAYLSFSELVYFIGVAGVDGASAAFEGLRVAAIDEWELDDPGNLKLALAFLRGALPHGVQVVVTSNTLPLELGGGRFSQKDFRTEIEELAGSFEVLTIDGDDYRHRHFEVDPGKGYFVSDETLVQAAEMSAERALLVNFAHLRRALEQLHPIRYAALVEQVDALFISGVQQMSTLPDALRWVHFVDTLYDSAVPLRASGNLALGDLFPRDFVVGPYGKKVSRCLSRMEEMLGEVEEP